MYNFFPRLPTIALFEGIEEKDLPSLLSCMGGSVKKYDKRQAIFLPGDEVKELGVVLSGSVQVIMDDAFGNRGIVGEVGAGELFAEAFCCAGMEKLPVGVEAKSDSEILFLNYRRVINTCTSVCPYHARLIQNMVSILATKNVELSKKLLHISQRTTREKLLSYLSEQAHAAGSRTFTIPFTRQELADYLCVERSAMATQLSRLCKEGVIETHRNTFRLL